MGTDDLCVQGNPIFVFFVLTFFCAIYFHEYFIFTATETFKTKPTLLYKQKALSCSCLFRLLAWVLLSGQDLMELAAHGLGWNANQAGLGLLILLLLLSSCWAYQCVPPTPSTCLFLKDKYCNHFNDLPFLMFCLVPSPLKWLPEHLTLHHTGNDGLTDELTK